MKQQALIVLLALAVLAIVIVPLRGQAPPQSQSAYAYINTETTTVVRGNAGYLNSLTINGGTAGVVTLYDIGQGGCTGTPASGKFAVIAALTGNPVTLDYNLHTNNGICVVTAAATDVTVAYN